MFCTEESHHWLATTGNRDRNGMLHFSHPLRGSVRGHLDWSKAGRGWGPVACRSEAPLLRSYMDDITCLLQTAPCTSRLLKRLEELITWARIKFKPQKSRSLSLRKGERNDRVTFTISGEDIPCIVDQPIRSLGRLYTSGLSDKDVGKIILRQLSEGLSKINASQLPGKFKVWCYHFTLYPRVMWPLKLCEVTSSAVSRMEAKANSFI